MLHLEAIRQIKDPELQNAIKRTRKLHNKIRAESATPFVEKTQELFSKLPFCDAVITYHKMEALLENVSDGEIEKNSSTSIRLLMLSIDSVPIS